jgi:hypothetical protein
MKTKKLPTDSVAIQRLSLFKNYDPVADAE